MATSIRTQRIARLVQKTLGDILLQQRSRLLHNAMVSVTEVQISPDLGIAKIYLSDVLNAPHSSIVDQVTQQKGALRKLLAQRLKNKLRRVPELRFYRDDSVAHAAKIDQILAEIQE